MNVENQVAESGVGGGTQRRRRQQPGGVAHTCNTGTWEMEAEDRGFKASLGCMRTHLNPYTHPGK